jgi:hypothetical protein
MAQYDIPRPEFTPCPEGQHKGVIYDIEDLGVVPTQYGDKRKIAVKIEVHTAKMDDGNPFIIQRRYNLTTGPKSELQKLRVIIAGRQLSDVEQNSFSDSELLNKHVGLVVTHKVTPDATYANVDQIWPLDDVAPHTPAPEAQVPTTNPPVAAQSPHQGQQPVLAGMDEPPLPSDDDLPF